MAKGIDNLKNIFKAQKTAFAKDPYPSLKDRLELLDAMANMVATNRGRIHDALREDFSCHPTFQADFTEVFAVLGRAEYNKSMIEKWMAPSQRDTDPDAHGTSKAYVLPQPKGVIGNMAPWNFPVDIGLGPTCDMLAAGNSVILKPSEVAPAISELLDEMVSATFDPAKFAVTQGNLDVAKAFPTLPWDHLLYTGNPEVARYVAMEAARNLTPLTLELGGKSPAIFASDAITPQAIANVLRVKMIKNGQMCISPDYALVPREKLSDFVSQAQTWVGDVASTYTTGDDITGIINDRHFERIQNLLKGAEDAGANIIQLTQDGDSNSRRMPLHLVVDPPADCALMREEIFGPVLPVVPYDDIDEVISSLSTQERPLGLYLYTNDASLKQKVISSTQSGGVTINGSGFHAAMPGMGFGGSGNSGYGRHHGIEGFREFSNLRGIFELDPEAAALNILPPYGEAAQAMVTAALGE